MADLPKVPAPLLRLFFFPLLASSSSPRFASDLEQARPQTTGEEELQLQLALAMSREEAEKVGQRGGAAPYPGVWPLWRRGGLGLPKGCALTRNCTGLLALCLHPNHSRHGGSTMDGTQTRALLLEPGMAWDGGGGVLLHSPNLADFHRGHLVLSLICHLCERPFVQGTICLCPRLLLWSRRSCAGMWAGNKPWPQLQCLLQAHPLSYLLPGPVSLGTDYLHAG